MFLKKSDINNHPTYPYYGIFEAQTYELIVGYDSHCILRYKDGNMYVFK